MRRVVAALAVSLLGACSWGHPVRMLSESRPFAARGSMSVRVDLPAGTIRVARGAPKDLYRLQFSYCTSHMRPLTRFTGPPESPGVENRLDVSASGVGAAVTSEEETNLVSLLLRTGMPLDLRVAGGVGSVEMDLTALSLKHLVVHGGTAGTHIAFQAGNPIELEQMRIVSGAGETRIEGLGWASVSSLQFYGGPSGSTLDWSGPGPREAAAFLDGGSGRLELVFPEDLGVTISGAGVESGQQAPQGMLVEGRLWVSPDYARAERHLNVVLERGAVPLSIRWLR